MTGRLEMGMLTRVWTGSCWVAAPVVAAAAGGRGAWVVVGGRSWLGLGFGFGQWVCVVAFVVLWAAWGAGSASTTQSPYMGQLLKTGLFSLFSALLVPFATFH